MGRRGTLFPHLQFMAQSVPTPQVVIMLGKGTRPLSGAQTLMYTVPPPIILHFNHCKRGVVMLSVASLCLSVCLSVCMYVCPSVCLSVCNAPTVKVLDLESSMLVDADTSSENVTLRITRSSSQCQGHRIKEACLCVSFKVIESMSRS